MKPLLLSLYVALAVYIGVGGALLVDLMRLEEQAVEARSEPVVYKGVSYDNAASFQARQTEERIHVFYGWLVELPELLALIITSCAFGAVGAATRCVKQALVDRTTWEKIRITLTVSFGALSGLLVIGLSYVVPSALTQGEFKLSPLSQIFLCLFVGAFSERFYKWIEAQIDNVFKTD